MSDHTPKTPTGQGSPAPEERPGPAQANDGKTDGTRQSREIGGQAGPEPTRYGDWEKNGIASDF
ncbi:DUF1674 domain-containing protein [Yunchengibacter salinarum]|uniref:DUF1674 domain-containing protein n=1 Tax=Yunchengibacter salinarum TaxID=3133399 RepID=UPI0035B5D8FB